MPPMTQGASLWSTLVDPQADGLSRATAASQLGGGGGGIDLSSAFSVGQQAHAAQQDDDEPAAPSSGGLGAISPLLTALVKKEFENIQRGGDEPLTSQDKGLALARAGFGMAAGQSPHALTNIGAGAAEGIDALQKMRMERAQMRMREMQGMTSALGTAALIPQRESRAALNTQALGLNAVARFTPQRAAQVADYIKTTGDYAGGLRMGGVGLTANANHAMVLDALHSMGADDIANNFLAFKAATAQATRSGENQAGPGVINYSEGQVRNMPPPLPVVRPGGGVTQPAASGGAPPAAAPAPASPAPPAPPAPKIGVTGLPVAVENLIPEPPKFGPAMSMEAGAEQKGMGSELAATSKAIDETARAAKTQNSLIGQMQAASLGWDMNPSAPVTQKAKEYLIGFNHLLPEGLQRDEKELQNSVGTWTDFNKMGGELVRQAVRATSNRAAVQEFNLIAKTLPTDGMTREGFNLIAAGLQGTNDFNLAKQKLRDIYLKKYGTLSNFESWVNDKFDPMAFMMSRLNADDRKMILGHMAQTPDGAALLKQIRESSSYASQFGLLGG